jgi:hypothetical protein
MEMFAIFTAPNRHSQCSPISTPTPISFATTTLPSHSLRFDMTFTHSMAPAVASKQRQVTKTGALKLLKRPNIVVAAKMSMSR